MASIRVMGRRKKDGLSEAQRTFFAKYATQIQAMEDRRNGIVREPWFDRKENRPDYPSVVPKWCKVENIIVSTMGSRLKITEVDAGRMKYRGIMLSMGDGTEVYHNKEGFDWEECIEDMQETIEEGLYHIETADCPLLKLKSVK